MLLFGGALAWLAVNIVKAGAWSLVAAVIVFSVGTALNYARFAS